MSSRAKMLAVTAVAALLTVSSGAGAQPAPADAAFDLLIKGGRVVDGTGAPWFYADLGVRDGRIAAIGHFPGHAAKETIDARGQVVSPGFIDMHSHSEQAVLSDGRAMSMIMQGITTQEIGEGSSPAPRKADADDGAYGIKPDWTTLRGYFDRLKKQGVSENIFSYIAAGQLREYVMGPGARRRATPAELEEMKKLLAQGMEDGAFGLVMALETPGEEQYPPEGQESLSMPTVSDLIALCKVVSKYGGIYANHMRDQGHHIVDGIKETARIGEEAHLPVEVFHIKAAGKPNFGLMPQALAAIHEARARGVDIAADVYPYIAASHGLMVEVPRWSLEGGTARFLQRAADPKLRPRIGQEMTQYMDTKYYNETTGAHGYDAVIVASVPVNPEKYVGKTLGEIAREQNKAPADAALDLLIEQKGKVNQVMYYMSEKDMRLAMADPVVSFDTDGTAVSPEFGGRPHPRYYGTFPRVLGRYVREEHVLALEDAIRKMTSLPAQRMGIQDRGVLRPGFWADLVVFDPDHVIDRATFDKPHAYPVGINDVVVNGVTVIRDGQHTGAKPGQPLYGPGRRN